MTNAAWRLQVQTLFHLQRHHGEREPEAPQARPANPLPSRISMAVRRKGVLLYALLYIACWYMNNRGKGRSLHCLNVP